MLGKISLMVASIALAAAPAAAFDPSASFSLRLTVGVNCTVQHQPSGYGAPTEDGVSLGELREYCNAPTGYQLAVSYAPGSLRGATVRVGNDEVVLTGSGNAILSRVPGPSMRNRTVSAKPGEAGFDTDVIQFHLVIA
jgi:hypothetical protein